MGEEGLGKEATYEFKYIPKFGQITGNESTEKVGTRYPGIERVALYGLLHLCFCIVIAVLVMVKLLGAIGIFLPSFDGLAEVGRQSIFGSM